MKKIIANMSLMALLFGAVSCDKKLDDGGLQGYATSAYMAANTATVVMNTTTGGETEIEPRLAAPATKNETITVSLNDFLATYNQENETAYRMLPKTEYVLYELENPQNQSTNGTITVTVKEGKISSKIRVKVKVLDTETYPLGVKYAIPFSIVSSSAKQVLSNKQVLVNFQRPVITSVAHVKQGYAPKIVLDETIGETEEFTFQAHFMLDKFTAYSTGIYNMSMISYGWYSRINMSDINLADTFRESAAEKVEVKAKTWHQVTYVHTKDHRVKIYLDGKWIRTFIRPNVVLKGGARISIFNPQRSYSAPHILREIRVWNKALNDAQINADLYTPVDANADGLIAYVPIDSEKNGYNDVTKYNNTVELHRATSPSSWGVQDGSQFHEIVTYEDYGIDKWYKNVEFPAGTLTD